LNSHTFLMTTDELASIEGDEEGRVCPGLFCFGHCLQCRRSLLWPVPFPSQPHDRSNHQD